MDLGEGAQLWTFKPLERPAETNAFLANTTVTGGLLALAAAGM